MEFSGLPPLKSAYLFCWQKMKLFSILKKKNKIINKYPWTFIENASPHWELECPKQDLKAFFIALESLVPEESMLGFKNL